MLDAEYRLLEHPALRRGQSVETVADRVDTLAEALRQRLGIRRAA